MGSGPVTAMTLAVPLAAVPFVLLGVFVISKWLEAADRRSAATTEERNEELRRQHGPSSDW